MSSSNSPCAACKIQRRKCTQECVFAPYFPPDQPQKFCNVHKVFGASNVSKLLQELNASQREDAVNSLAYEAEARLRDPVYGCVGLISILQHRLRQVQTDLITAKKELASYVGPHAAMVPLLQPPPPAPYLHCPPPPQQQQFLAVSTNNSNPSSSSSSVLPPMMGIPKGVSSSSSFISADHTQQQQQFFEAQQLAAVMAAREAHQQEMLRMSLEQKLRHQPQEFVRVVNSTDSGFDPAGPSSSSVAASSHGFNPNMGGGSSSNLSPTLALGTFENSNFHVNQPQQSEHHHLHLLREQLMLGQTPQPAQPQQQLALHQHQTQMLRKLDGEEGKSVGPSC